MAKTAATQYCACQLIGHAGVITEYPEAVQYFLCTYTTPYAIRHGTSALRAKRKLSDEDKSAYSVRVNKVAYRCGNSHIENEKMKFL